MAAERESMMCAMMVTVESILRRELALHGRSLDAVAMEACMTTSSLVAALQGRRFVPSSIRLELSELVGTALPPMEGAGILSA